MELQTVSDHNPKGASKSIKGRNGPTSAFSYTKMIHQVQPPFKLQLSVIGQNCDLVEPQNAQAADESTVPKILIT
jgi:hypothetical protein